MANLISSSLWLLVLLSLLLECAFASDTIPPPGQPAFHYENGSFSSPDDTTYTFAQNTVLNLSWTTIYETSDVYIIKNQNWSHAVTIVVNTAVTWFEWEVATDSTNASDVYVLRGVNGQGTAADKLVGGFLSAQFYIDGLDNQVTTTASASTVSLASPVTSSSPVTTTATTATSASASVTSPAATTTAAASGGLSTGAKTGIGIGIGLGSLGVISLGLGLYLLRKHRTAMAGAGTGTGASEAERTSMMMDNDGYQKPPPMSSHDPPAEVYSPQEIAHSEPRYELSEAAASKSAKPVYEMDT